MRAFRVALLAMALISCGGDGTPQLISVRDLLPREAEIGDRIQILGDGFPQGRTAWVRFRGTLHRPGQAPEHAEIETTGTATSPSTVEVVFDEELQSRFCGVGRRAAHTTFAGDVEVAFSPALEGAPPVAGSAAGAELDVRPPSSPREIEAAKDEGLRTLAALGIRVDASARSDRGITITGIDPGSRAETSGLLAGDVLVSWSGVRVGSLADIFLPSAAAVRVSVRRGASPAVQSHEITTAGIAAKGSIDALPAVLIVAFAIGVALGLGAPRPRWLVRLEATMSRTRMAPRSDLGWSAVACLAPWLVVSVLRIDLDLLTLVLASIASLVATAVVTRSSPHRALGALVPFALCTLASSHATGTLRLGDAVRAQGALPWHWQIARDPFAAFAFLLALAPLAIGQSRGVMRLVTRLVTGVVAGMLVLSLFGGWAVPPAIEGRMAILLGGFAYAAKTTFLLWILFLAARARIFNPEIVWTRIVPASAACALGSLALAELAPPRATRYFVAVAVALLPIAAGIALRALRPRARWTPSAIH